MLINFNIKKVHIKGPDPSTQDVYAKDGIERQQKKYMCHLLLDCEVAIALWLAVLPFLDWIELCINRRWTF